MDGAAVHAFGVSDTPEGCVAGKMDGALIKPSPVQGRPTKLNKPFSVIMRTIMLCPSSCPCDPPGFFRLAGSKQPAFDISRCTARRGGGDIMKSTLIFIDLFAECYD